MSKMRQFFFPPLYWQEFETLTASVATYAYQTRNVDMIGRAGQTQNGVDVHVDANGTSIGIQCKRRVERDENNDPLPGGAITRSALVKALDDAQSFNPKLDQFVLATTAQREGEMQEVARELSAERRRAGLSGVKLWFWDDYVTFLNLYDPLERLYYDTIINVRTPEDQDRKIIDVITRAFHRPAFQDPIASEHGEAFSQALADTVQALNSGILIDRQSRHTFRVAYGGRDEVMAPIPRRALADLHDDVALLRETYALAVKQGRIVQKNGYLDVVDRAIEQFLDRKREDCLVKVQALREEVGLKAL